MMSLVVVLAVVLIATAVLMLAAHGHSAEVTSIDQLAKLARPVDLDAFRNLVSRDDEDFLRRTLPALQYWRVERARMRALFEYVSRIAHNSALLMRLGQAGQRSSASELVGAGEELANIAFQMRVLCLVAMPVILLRIILPQLRISPATLGDTYERTRDRATSFGRLQHPAAGARAEAAL
jgi:hypothetical protein